MTTSKPTSRRGRTLRLAGIAGLGLVGLVVVALGAAWALLDASLPRLDGTIRVFGPRSPVRLERDARGRTTVVAATRDDLAFGLGFAHGQDRYFQMDLLRRAGSGEVAALIGRLGLDYDRTARQHDFAGTAERALAQCEPRLRTQIEAYARGVNEGRASLGARPWEYFVLRQTPRPWRPIDTYHVLLAMTRDLQPIADRLELGRLFLRANLVPSVVAAVLDPGNPWDAPIEGNARPAPVVDVPPTGPGLPAGERGLPTGSSDVDVDTTEESEGTPARGSNSFAVGGAYTDDGRALLANDMHLGLSVPTIWYAARLVVDDAEKPLDAIGVSLPGAPGIVVGTNGSIAWGFTNSYGDWLDHVLVDVDPEDTTRYRSANGWIPFDERTEVIEVAHDEPDTFVTPWTVWGPQNVRLRDTRYASHWVAHEPEAIDLRLLHMMDVTSVDAALELANRCGIPHQNFVVAGADGRLAWTIIGRVPRRVGMDGTEPVSWADGTRGWAGWLEPDEVPRHVYGPTGRIWTANGRVTTLENQAVLGDAGYALGARATVIRDALRARDAFDEHALYVIQNLTRSPLMEQWYGRLRRVVDDGSASGYAGVAPWLDDWTGGADASSVAYRVTRAWRREVTDEVYDRGLMRPTWEDAGGHWVHGPRSEPVVWSLLEARPDWVPNDHAGWDELERAALDSLVAVWGEPSTWSDRTWGARNTTEIAHPLAAALPGFLAGHLRLPPRVVDGDAYTARVTGPGFGASQRLVVAPGAEERGILQLPGGNAAHPRSPFFLGDYEDWVAGEPTPLLPGPSAHVLVLEPGS